VSTPPLRDRALPPGFEPQLDDTRSGQRGGAGWSPSALARLAERLMSHGPPALAELDEERFLDAWSAAVDALRDPASPARQALEPELCAAFELSPQGLRAGLENVLWGVRREAARRLRAASPRRGGGLTLVILAGNLPGLAVQPLLRGLARGDAVLLKSPSAEPAFAPAFARELAAADPRFGECVAAVCWPGGDHELEAPLIPRASRIEVFGDAATIASWRERAGERLVSYGPRLSIGVVARDADLGAAARGLARDIALFDQRGCLSPQAILVEGDAPALAERLAVELARIADELPPGAPAPARAAALQQLRAEAEMRGLALPRMSLAAGTVIVESGLDLRPTPGLRSVRVHALPSLDALPAALVSMHGRIQGVAVAGTLPAHCEALLRRAGVTRIAPAGELQLPEADWDGADQAPGLSA
jgi:acyl-CoA reductase LuxC